MMKIQNGESNMVIDIIPGTISSKLYPVSHTAEELYDMLDKAFPCNDKSYNSPYALWSFFLSETNDRRQYVSMDDITKWRN